jgi:type VI secretion system secreted protein VgrG
MIDILFSCADAPLTPTALTGRERLGEVSSFDLDLLAPHPVDPSSILGKPAAILLTSPFGQREIHGIISRFTVIATSQPNAARRYRATVASEVHLLTLRRRSLVFQHLTVPAIIEKVLHDAGFPTEHIEKHLAGDHSEREYCVQYAETDAAFIRRLCEEEGLYFRFEAKHGYDAFVLEDTSTSAPAASDAKIPVVDGANLTPEKPAAYACTSSRKRRPGKVTVRDYDPQKPALSLEGAAQGGKPEEKEAEVYRAPGRFKTPAKGDARAKVLLESLRAEAKTLSFEATALSLAPGLSVELSPAADYAGTANAEGKFLVVEIEHTWRAEDPKRAFRVKAIPLDVPYRLAVVTPKPKISGVHSAVVTGAPGDEIHTDKDGCVRVRFHWDREGPSDDKSSLPVRVMQPNTPGSMLIPRVGWEVMVAFEDGDPDRPYVLGRTYNAKQPPPFPLPANKTITSLSTVSSPGGAKQNSLHIDDAAGRQHMVWNAGFAKTTTVANNMMTQTVGFEQHGVKGNQTWTIGGNQTLSVQNALMVSVGSQTASVGGMQKLMVKATGRTSVGSEAVLVGGALIEQVGNPVTGAKAFAEAAVLAGVSEIPGVGPFLSKGYSIGKALGEAYAKGGMKGLVTAAEQQALNEVGSHIPGGDALVAAADGAGLTPWSDKAQAKAAAQAAGGGTGGPSAAAAGAAEAAPGFRKTIVDGIKAESIGAAHTVTTPGSIKWTTLGASSFAVGVDHTTRAVKVSRLTAGLSSDTAASIDIKTAQFIGRTVTGALKTSVSGALDSDAGGPHHIKVGGNATIKVGGSMDLEGGAVVFMVDNGSAIVAAHAGGILLKASTVTINGKSVQSGKATNQ